MVTRRGVSAWLLGGGLAASAGAGFFARGFLPKEPPAARPMLRFSISTGEVQVMSVLRMIPGGGAVSFIGRASGQVINALFILRLDGSAPRVVQGTDNVVSYVFSPDGKWIAFTLPLGASTMSKVSVNGGQPVLLCSEQVGFVSDWTKDGRILAGPGVDLAVRGVTESTGKTEILIPPTTGESRNATMLPGGRHLLFERIGSGRAMATKPLSVDGINILLDNAQRPQYLASGHILFSSAGAWAVIPFDVRSVRAVGPVTRLSFAAKPFLVDADNHGTMVSAISERVERARPDSSELKIASAQGKVLESVSIPRRHTQIKASPDGRYVLLATSSSTSDVWSYELGRGTQTRLTTESEEDETPVWSPDGKRFAYSSVRPGGRRSVVIRPADGSGGERIIWFSSRHFHLHDWSPDGRSLLLTVVGAGADLCVLAVDGGAEPTPFFPSPHQESDGAFSPDGRWLAYTSNESGTAEVYVRPFPVPGGRWQISTQGGSMPRWSRSGKDLFYKSGVNLMAVSIEAKVEFTAGKPRQVLEMDGVNTAYDVLPDGRFVMLAYRAGLGNYASRIDVTVNWFDELRRIAPPSASR